MLAQVAPDELEVFETVARSWRANGLRAGRLGGGIGFGVELTLLADLLLQAGGQVLGEGALRMASQGRARWRRGRRRKPALPTALTPEQIQVLRTVCRRHGATLGLSAETADLLADALVGAACAAVTTQ